MPHPTADHNMLFGVLAFKLGFIPPEGLIAALEAWAADKTKALGPILQRQGLLTDERYDLLEALVREHLKQHGNDPHRSLLALSSLGNILPQLAQISDPDVQQTLTPLGGAPPPPADDQETRAPDAQEAACKLHATGAGSDVQASAGDPFRTLAPAQGDASPTARPDPSTGRGRFRILRPHARGGLGEVFVARDEELQREVALKEIQDRHADHPDSRARFLLEAEVTGRLEHPGIVPVYGLGQYADGRPYYAMRFIKGDSLAEAVDRFHGPDAVKDPGQRGMGLRQLLGRFVDVCNAIAYAHSRGVLHRDLKPGNVMLGQYGETLVVDWGLAKYIDSKEVDSGPSEASLRPTDIGRGAPTQMGQTVGTPAYMSPEQAAGQLDQLGPPSDVYSLGATLYHLLIGRPPFTGQQVGAILAQVMKGEFPPPRQVDPTVPPALEAVCLKAMALRPGDRYGSVRTLADDVEHWLADEPVAAHRESWGDWIGRWARRHKGLVRSTAAAGLAIVATVLAALVLIAQSRNEAVRLKDEAEDQRRQAQLAQQQAEDARQRVEDARRQTDKALHATRNALYVHRVGQAERELAVNDQLHAWETLNACRPEERNWEWHYLNRRTPLPLLRTNAGESNILGVAFSFDGKRIATASSVRQVQIWDATTGKEMLDLEGHSDCVWGVAFSPDGKRLASGSWDQTVRIWDAATGKLLWSLRNHTDKVYTVAFSPDGRRLASASQDHTVRIWDLTTGKEVFVLKGHPNWVMGVAWSPDGKLIASAGDEATLKIWDAATGQEKLSLEGHTAAVLGVAFSPDSTRLASSSRDRTVKLWDVGSGEVIFNLHGHLESVPQVAFSSDGRRIASASWDRTVRVWDASNGKTRRILRGHGGSVTTLAFSPDGQRLVTGSWDHTAKVWDVAASAQRTLIGHEGGIRAVAFSPDSRLLASGGDDSTVKVWKANTGQVLRSLNTGKVVFSSLAFSPDGNRMVKSRTNETMTVWDVLTGKEVCILNGHSSMVRSVAFTLDGSRVVSGSYDKTVRVWDAHTGKNLFTLAGHTDLITSVAVSPDGKRILSASWDKMVKVWDALKGNEISSFKGHAEVVTSVAYSPDGQRIVTGSQDATVKIRDATTGRVVLSLHQGKGGEVCCLAFSPDGNRLAVGTGDGQVKLWDTTSGQHILTLQGHKGGVRSVAFSPDGKLLASGGDDEKIQIWDGSPAGAKKANP